MVNMKLGKIHVYTGDGKGKTTAALGVALRAIGCGARVCMIQFIKGYANIGEARFAEQSGGKFVLRQFAKDSTMDIDESDVLARKQEAQDALAASQETISRGDFDIVILDEINNALHYHLIDISPVMRMLESRPDNIEIILTGRSAPEEIIGIAHYVTEMKLIRHPYPQEREPRAGVDY